MPINIIGSPSGKNVEGEQLKFQVNRLEKCLGCVGSRVQLTLMLIFMCKRKIKY